MNIAFTLIYTALLLFFPAFAHAQTPPANNCMVDGVPTLKCLENITENVLNIATGFVVLVLFVMFVYGSFLFLTAYGNAKQVQQAQSVFKWAVVGTVIFMASYLILNIVDMLFLGGQGTLFKINLDNSQ